MAAAAAKRRLKNGDQANYFEKVGRWIMDTGSGVDICRAAQVPAGAKTVKPKDKIVFNTANGPIDAGPMLPGMLEPFDEAIAPFILPDTPALLSVGKRCFSKGYGFLLVPLQEAFHDYAQREGHHVGGRRLHPILGERCEGDGAVDQEVYPCVSWPQGSGRRGL